VTRSEDQADELCSLLEAEGAVPVRCATIRVAPPACYDALDSALSQLDAYGWLVLTSPNGVRSVFGRLERLGVQVSALEGVRVAAVGPATAAALAAHGVRPAFVPGEARSRALAESLSPVVGERILLARADIADPAAADILRHRGARHVDDVAAYTTVSTAPSAEALQELKRGVDGITFTSPSTVRGLTLVGPGWPELVAKTTVATVGPVTTAAARTAGLDVHAEAAEPTMGGLVAALARGVAERTEEDRRK
jgi:uroporphyrinogen III methyltransferase/synthase